VQLTFLGTCGEIERRTRRHRRHSALLIQAGCARVLLDCGADWQDRIDQLRPSAIVLTHGHPDHAWGLAVGAPCPVFATEATWPLLAVYPIPQRRLMPIREPLDIGGLVFEAFPVDHSTRAPAVGYRIAYAGSCFFYVPDVIAIHDRKAALGGVALYIGDGSAVARSLVRRSAGALVGHTSIRAQLGWCEDEGVRQALFTHCGSEIVGGNGRQCSAQVRRLGRDRGVVARLAYDGLVLALPEDYAGNGIGYANTPQSWS
jgi:phosphoribosyl 1,2-cyclic phosphodiesterase